MYIKEIKANGFKSFADKVNLELNKNFTGIVGPNGSGKSNIVDAIKWVLGEQSVKTLRSENMTDVIFNGSKNREAMNSASVTIVFDNSDKHLPIDYEEVSIKRIVYRSGENEYYLGGEKCRLKDLSNLFIDSFSSKESINIISQGKISEILSNKPEERRMVIEEAAGVLKYKKRKEESLRKLSKTHENIERIDMIINELKNQVLPLKDQAEKAKIYKSKKEELENIECSLIVNDIEKYSKIYNDNKEKSDELNKRILNSTSIKSKEEVTLEKNKSKLFKINDEITNLQKRIIESNNIINELEKKKELCKERTKYDREDVKVRNHLMSITEESLKVKNNISAYKKELEIFEEEKTKLNEKISSLMEEYKVTTSKYNIENEKFDSLSKKEIVTKGNLDVIINSIETNARVPFSVKSILDNPRLRGIKNTIGSVVECDEKYSTMLEIALGANVNVIITENDSYAKEAIEYLKTNKKGRATFFPMNVIKPKYVDADTIKSLKEDSSFIGVVSSLVNYESMYDNIIKNVLGNILVVDNIDNANKIGKKINNRYRIVTLDGELIHVGGSLTGGSIKQENSIIFEKYEKERLNNLLDTIKREKENSSIIIKELNRELDILKESIYKTNVKRSEIDGKVSISLTILEDNEKRLVSLKEEIKSLSGNKEDRLNEELQSIMDSFYKEESNKKNLEIKSESLINERKNINEIIEDIELTIKNNNSEFNELNNILRNLEVESAKASVNLDNLLNLLNETYNITFEGAKEKYILTINENEARNIVFSLKSSLKDLGEVNIGSIEEYERVSKRYDFLETQKKDLIDSEENLLKIINEMDETMESKFKETFDSVNKEFNKVFNNLFRGGEAYLKLTDPDNLLETGIEIVALPPGKKLKINQLSGGEMTLTAISLLFAIMNLKDVPFAVLDEIEAALDEVNVEKFGSYLENYRGKTQMILITHKKKTMEYVDMLYGITMQESGVSKLVSVRLEDITQN